MYKRLFLIGLFILGMIPGLFGGTEMNLNLMPVPKKIAQQKGQFRLNDSFRITLKGIPTERLCKYSTRVLRRLTGRTGLFLLQDFITMKDLNSKGDLIIETERAGKIELKENESYQLKISKKKIHLMAETDIGAMRGLETLLQLLSSDEKGCFFPGVEIEDQPRFPWRGLLIDACRHFQPVEVIKRNLDGMAAVKLNVLHWHLTEDQGFRIECKTWPKLHELGSDGLYYTQEQIREIVAYAADRGIRVMPEFDIPGHATSWLMAYPELGSGAAPKGIQRKWGVFDPTINPTDEQTYEFIDKFFEEMTTLFTDEYWHIGGDENNGKHWNSNPEIQEFMKKNEIADNHALQSYFNQRVLNLLTRYNKKMVGWDEILHETMPNNIVIQSWRGREAMINAAQKGFQSILSNGYYIDLIYPASDHYLNDPLPEDSPLTDEEKELILGGEATMWAEFVSPETIDSRIWPRAAAIAERFWSPGNVKDVPDMYRRLEVVSFHLEELGLLHEKNYMMFLRRLTNNQDIEPLKNLIDVLEPVKGYRRNSFRDYRQQSPLTRVVDAARPDAKVARDFRNRVDEFLANETPDPEIMKWLDGWLQVWLNNHAELLPIIKSSPILFEIQSLSEDLSGCAIIGMQCLEFIKQGQKAEPKWIERQLEFLKKAKEPRGEAELMIVSATEKLVQSLN